MIDFTPVFVVTVQDIVGGIFLGLLLVVVIAITLYNIFKQSLCKHDGDVNETRSCDAICRKCGKNLGFIGAWRENNERK